MESDNAVDKPKQKPSNFRYHGFYIDDQNTLKRYYDVLDKATDLTETLRNNKDVKQFFADNPHHVLFPVVRYASENGRNTYLGCVCFRYKDQTIVTFAAFNENKKVREIGLERARHIPSDVYKQLIYIAENNAKLLNKYKDRDAVYYNHDYGVRWKDIIHRERLEDFQNVKDLHLIEQEEGKVIPVQTPEELSAWAKKRTESPPKRRQKKDRGEDER